MRSEKKDIVLKQQYVQNAVHCTFRQYAWMYLYKEKIHEDFFSDDDDIDFPFHGVSDILLILELHMVNS